MLTKTQPINGLIIYYLFMKSIFVLLLVLSSLTLKAQEEDLDPVTYQTAAGFYVDWNSDLSLYGGQIKQFFSETHALNAQLLFGEKLLVLGLDYTFNGMIPMPMLYKNFSWYAGVGPQLSFIEGGDGTTFAIRPMVGLEYKLKELPFAASAELKPSWSFGENGDFELMRLGFSVKYILNRDIW